MSSSDYHFITEWNVRANTEEVYAILSDTDQLTNWWPSVYLDVLQSKPGNNLGVGKEVQLYTKGWLPYTLKWSFVVEEVEKPSYIRIRAIGDFNGFGIWTIHQKGEHTHIQYDWKISTEKPIIKYLSFLMKPLFSANHRWAMQKGEESLKLELLRRRGIHVAPPPVASFPHNLLDNHVFDKERNEIKKVNSTTNKQFLQV